MIYDCCALAICLIFLAPVGWAIFSAFQPPGNLFTFPPNFGGTTTPTAAKKVGAVQTIADELLDAAGRALGDHPGHERLDSVQHAEEVDPVNLMPAVDVVVEIASGVADARVEERDVQPAAALRGFFAIMQAWGLTAEDARKALEAAGWFAGNEVTW